MSSPYVSTLDRPVLELDVSARARFIVRTYAHLLGAIAAFTAIEVALFTSGVIEPLAVAVGNNFLIAMGAFIVVSWLATSAAHRVRSAPAQYAALAGFVLAEAIIFAPLLYIAFVQFPGAISSAAAVTLTGFAGLTGVAIWTRKDFSFMGAALRWIGISAVLLIGASLIFGWHLGTWFSVGMVVFAGCAILYDTSNILHHYPEDRHVAASLSLFASVAMMFWYVLRLFMSRD